VKLAVALSLLLLLPTDVPAEDFFQPIPMAEVARLRGRSDVAVFDVNVEELWVEHSIPGSVHIDSPDIAKFLPADKTTLLIFYCAGPGSRRSPDAANAAILLGYRRVYVMADGIFEWLKAGYPVE
jgi:rhodanese-related sulfurtransferase